MTDDQPSSRAATNDLLGVLREGQWRPRAWGRFLARTAQRSVQQAILHPRALAEVTVLHAAFAVLGPRKRPAWTLTSWALAATHLGMLEHRRSIGWANAITLTRANRPTFTDHRWTAVLAVGTDLADGRLAARSARTPPSVRRQTRWPTPRFGPGSRASTNRPATCVLRLCSPGSFPSSP